MSASRHVQDLDRPVVRPEVAAGPHVPTVVDVDALRLPSPLQRRPRLVRAALPAEREPTFDELLHGPDGPSAGTTSSSGPGWFRSRRAARVRVPTSGAGR